MTGEVEDVYELSPLQQGMLLHSLHGGDADSYVAQHSFAVEGPLDADALARAWQDTVAAHTALRSTFHWEGLDKPLQVVHRSVDVELRRHDWSGLGEDESAARMEALLADERAAGFDLEQAPLLRLHLVRHDEERHTFVWTHHMLPVDGWSVPIVISDVVLRYRSLTDGYPPPAPATPYREYIAWLQGRDPVAAQAYWTEALGGGADIGPLGPLEAERPGAGPAVVDERTADFPAELRDTLRAVAARRRVTFNTMIQAAWAMVLRRHTGSDRVQFGFASSGRPPELPGVERMVGTFVNSLPLRVPVPADGDLGEWLRELQAGQTAARTHEYAPLAQIKRWAGVTATRPLFDSLLVLENYRVEFQAGALAQRLSFHGLTDFEKTSEPLTVFLTAEPASRLRVLFHRGRIEAAAVERILADFRATLEAMAAHDRIGAIAAAVAAAHPADPRAAGPAAYYPDAATPLHELIRRQAAATPEAVALVADEGELTYRELLGRAGRVAQTLTAAGAGPGTVVGVCAERSPELVTLLLGTLLAGAAYLPLDPSLPAARLEFMRADADARIVLASPGCAGTARGTGAPSVISGIDYQAAGDAAVPGAGGTPGAARCTDAAYVLYTSGSTGRPKGVVVTHEAIVNRLLWMQETFALGAADRVLHKTPFGFDVSVWELFWPLLTGARLVLARPGGHQDAAYLARTLEERGVTTAHFVPSMLQLFLDEPGLPALSALRRVVCSGEALPHALATRFRESVPGVGLYNLYGPTEAAVDVTWWDCAVPTREGVLPIGNPVANTGAFVLDERLDEAPRTVPGELYLGGVQLARAYLGRAALTAQRFVAHPLAGPGRRLYRTGDRVRRLADGSLEFLGRIDHQVKIHGYRIELGEIEQELAGHPAVREAAVVVRERAGSVQLAGYVTAVADQGSPPIPCADADPACPEQALGERLREHLRGRLPRYMLPATITVLPAMPLTHNGKLDRAALNAAAAAPSDDRAAGARPHGAPATPREQQVAAAFGRVLGLEVFDAGADFFELGGTSFDAVRAVRELEGATVADITADPTVRGLAARLDAGDRQPGMLLRLTAAHADRAPRHAVVCIPFGGGSAIAYRALAAQLDPGHVLYAATLPGHEPGGEQELRGVEETAQACAEAVLALDDGPVTVYGHCAGVAVAVEVVRRVEEAGRPVQRLVLGASYPFYEPGRGGRAVRAILAGLVRRGILRVSARTVGTTAGGHPRSDRAEMRYLRAIGGFGTDVDDETLAFVMRAFRHDVAEGARYFTRRWSRRAESVPSPLEAPITFVAGSEDPLTAGYEESVRMWERYSEKVELAVIPGGGHYFLGDRARELAEIVTGTPRRPAG
jgi:amino acid adenylation domain-containing protein